MLKEHLDGYVEEIVRKKYHILKTSDNFYLYKTDIKKWLGEMRQDYPWLLQVCERNKRLRGLDIRVEELEEQLDMIERGFDDIEHRIINMDREHTRYIRATVTRLNYLLNREDNMKGLVIQLLNHLSEAEGKEAQDREAERIGALINLSQMTVISEKSLYKRRRLKQDFAEGLAPEEETEELSGEEILNKLCSTGFTHSRQSVRLVEVLEKDGQGLNLTKEVRDGILNHGLSARPSTLEGDIVRLSDKIAYINHDIDDAIRGRIFKEEDLPGEYTDVLGHSVRERLNTMIRDIIENSQNKPAIVMSPPMEKAMKNLREWMFNTVYSNSAAKAEEGRAQMMIQFLYEYYMDHVEILPGEYLRLMWDRGESRERVVCDYIAGMSDRFAIDMFEELFVPKSWKAL